MSAPFEIIILSCQTEKLWNDAAVLLAHMIPLYKSNFRMYLAQGNFPKAMEPNFLDLPTIELNLVFRLD